jgi:hypothetical protein
MVVELCEGSNITVDNYWPALIVGDYSSNGGASLTITGGSYKATYYDGMEVNYRAVATVLGGTIQGGQDGYGMSVWDGAVATVCDGTIQGGYGGMFLYGAVATVLGGMMIGDSPSPGYGFWNYYGDATITGGTFKGGFNSTSGDGVQAPSLVAQCGNTSIYGGTYEGNWINVPYSDCYNYYTITKVYGKDLVVKGNHLMGTLCDGKRIDVYILGDPSTVYIENNCTSFPKFDECGGKGGKSGKKTKGSLFRP